MAKSKLLIASSKPVVDTDTFADYFIVFRSEDAPDRFEAHSLRTDQIGIGDSPVDALYELTEAVSEADWCEGTALTGQLSKELLALA